jgi:hypothetical protein
MTGRRKEMGRPEGYIGTLSVTWDSGEKQQFEISLSNNRLWIGTHAVSPFNEKSLGGVLREISQIIGREPSQIKTHTWTELIQPLQFPK